MGQQERYLSSPAFEALFGGAAGPGKTDCLVMEALRQVSHPKYTAILFRRTFGMLEAANGIIQRSLTWYPACGGIYNQSKHFWTFPSGARIYFGHMEHEGDELNYQGAEYSLAIFDELTEFTENMYLYMFTRCRPAAPGLRAYVRAATNPGNLGHRWVKQRFITRDITNRLRWFAMVQREDGSIKDTEVARDHVDDTGQLDALSRAFYPALLADNPSADPRYRIRIRATGDPVQIARLEHGDWDAEYSDGLIYATFSTGEGGNVTSDADYRPGEPVYWGCDDGYVYGDGPGHTNYHPRVILFIQDNPLGGMDIFDEIVVTEENRTETLARALAKPYARPYVAYVDGSAATFRGEIGKHGITNVNGTHVVTEGIKSVRALVQNGAGVRTLRVHPRCQHTIYEFGEYRTDPKDKAISGELVPLKVDDHSCDALRYVAHKRRHFRGVS